MTMASATVAAAAATSRALPKRILLGSDHAGYDLRVVLGAHLKGLGVEVVEQTGAVSATERANYPTVGADVATQVVAGDYDLGIVVCGSGIGISIAANKVNGARCALVHNAYTSQMARRVRTMHRMSCPMMEVEDEAM